MIPTRQSTFATALWQTRGLVLALVFVMAAALALAPQAPMAQAAPTTFTVTNTADSGEGSLREAITEANANSNPAEQDTIEFDIQADTDTGCDVTTGVCTISPDTDLPAITEAVVMDGYSQDGASPNTLTTGSDAELKIELNGFDSSAGQSGIAITGSNSVVKGLVINGWFDGIAVTGSGAAGNRIEGNFLGTDADGTGGVGNINGVQISAPGNTVGGTSPAARNVVSANRGFGIDLSGPNASGNKIQGNYVGTDASGQVDLGNAFIGVQFAAPNNTLGGTSAAARNVISGTNDGEGVRVAGAGGNRIQGNYVGTDASGQEDLGNSEEGLAIVAAPNTVVGGTSAAAANTVAFNAGDGVRIERDGATGNSVLRNSIHSNGGLGIDLDDGTEDANDVTANDPQDPDPGPNLLQNFPVITSAKTPDGRSITIRGTLNSTPNDAFNVQLFSSPEADPSGFGEGKTYLGQINVTTNAGGNATFSFSSPNASVLADDVVSATATNSVTGDTSEFSEAIVVEDDTVPRVLSTYPPDKATGVPPSVNLSATFSEQMRASSINENSFRLFERVGGSLEPVEAGVSYAPTVRKGILRPDGDLRRGAQYVARVYRGARDLAGNRLAEPETFTFSVRD